MSQYLLLRFQFLTREFHGRGARDEPEWPPSPLRAFQALVACAAARGDGQGRELAVDASDALSWLESLAPPIIVAPKSRSGATYVISVPLNEMDKVATAWSRNREDDPATHRTMKKVSPSVVAEGSAVHFLWRMHDGEGERNLAGPAIKQLAPLARGVSSMGWGGDLVVGDLMLVDEASVNAVQGVRWIARDTIDNHNGTRIPVPGTLKALSMRHKAFLERTATGNLVPPPALTSYEMRRYVNAAAGPDPVFAAFAIRSMDDSRFRAADPVRGGLSVAGMTKGAAKDAAARAGWTHEEVAGVILGHGEKEGSIRHEPVRDRLAYVPLPSIEPRGPGMRNVVGSIRRVLVLVPEDPTSSRLTWVARYLNGQELISEANGKPVAFLRALPPSDGVLQRYLGPASAWVSVTPVVLPGYDDPRHLRRRLVDADPATAQTRAVEQLSRRVDGLIRKAIRQAGYSEELAALADLDWRTTGFMVGVEHASRYDVPSHLKRFSRLHARIQWRDQHGGEVKLNGPICIGAGRFYGLGLFAPEDENDAHGIAHQQPWHARETQPAAGGAS